jgi:hypothetical protein
MDVKCSHCHALHFDSEKLTKSTRRNRVFGMCCLEGQVQLRPLQEWPDQLKRLYDDRQFREKIRQYNSALAFTSMGAEVDRHTVQGAGPTSFRIHGALHHLMGSLIPNEGHDPCYAQLYIYDPEQATDHRTRRNPDLNRQTLADLHDMLFNFHPYVDLYKQAYQIMMDKPPEQHPDLRVQLHFSEGTDGRRYNLPTANEIAAIIPGDGSDAVNEHRDIVLRLQGGGLRRISHLNQAYATLHYVLLFPQGEEGWHLGMPLQPNARGRARSKHLTQMLYYAHRLHVRPPNIEPPNLIRGGRLFQQYVCDAWASVEQSNLTWVVNNQKKIRSELYSGLRDRIAQDPGLNLQDAGRSVVLPSSHSGSPRHMQQLLQDSLAICRDCQKPDFFLTMTANGNWAEIKDNLLPGMFSLFLPVLYYFADQPHGRPKCN